MDFPIILFMDDEDTYRVLIPDFEALSFTCESLDKAYSIAQKKIENHLDELVKNSRQIPHASKRDRFVSQYLDAFLVSKVTISTSR